MGVFGTNRSEYALGVGPKEANAILRQLVTDGYVEPRESPRDALYENTVKGNALAMASAAPPVKRERTRQQLEAFIERVKEVNADNQFLYKIDTVVLFGSFLGDSATVNDVDLAIKLVPKITDRNKFHELLEQRIREALNDGGRFGNIVEQTAWPQTEVKRYLKARSRILSLHDLDDGVLKEAESEVIYSTEHNEQGSIPLNSLRSLSSKRENLPAPPTRARRKRNSRHPS